jgi:hypothetical protein
MSRSRVWQFVHHRRDQVGQSVRPLARPRDFGQDYLWLEKLKLWPAARHYLKQVAKTLV